ncbi:MAG: diphthine synthase [Desulfurococcales archaeon]|nr:diphthine synthase [Desulfurococcales archaeon]
MPLILAGAGVYPGSVTSEVAGLVASADRVYVDTYTMPGADWLLAWARRVAGERVAPASREALEARAREVVEEARRGTVVVLVPGDPLIATTHVSLLVEAAGRGVEWRVAPGVSGAVSAKVLSGLQYYRFGRTVTIPGPWRGVRAVSVVSQIYGNLCVGLHTLALLDVSEDGSQLPPAAGAGTLVELEGELARDMGVEEGVLPGLLAAVVERAGTPEARAYWGTLGGIASGGGSRAPSSIVVAGIVHPTEADVLEGLYGVSRGEVERHNAALRESRLRACRVYEALAL